MSGFFLVYAAHSKQVKAETQSEIEQQKAEKQKQLDSVVAEINAILSSRASLSQKIKDLQSEKAKMEGIIGSMKDDLKKSEDLAKSQDEELNKISQQYALNQALYYVQSQKTAGLILFESKDMMDFLDRMLYFSVQDKLMNSQKEYILTKKEGIDKQKKQIEDAQKELEKSLETVNAQLSQLYSEQETLNAKLQQTSSARKLLANDISNLSKKEQEILNSKAQSNPPTSGSGSSGSSGSSGTAPTPAPGTVISTKSIDVTVGNTLFTSTDNVVSIRAKNGGYVYLNKSCGGCNNPEIAYEGTLIFDKSKRRNFTSVEGSKSINVINDIPVELYLRGLGEMPSSWGRDSKGGIEALKAQVVAARTYAFKKMENYKGLGFDLYDTTDDQAYDGVGKVFPADGQYWDKAVRETKDFAIVYGGKPISAFYSSSAGGQTLATEESPSFGSYLAYSRSISDRFIDPGNGQWADYGLNVPDEGVKTSYWRPSGSDTFTASDVAWYVEAALFLDPDGDGSLVSSAERQKLTNGTDWHALLGTNTVAVRAGVVTSAKHIYDDGGSTIQQNTKYTKYVEVTGEKGTVRVSGQAFRTAFNLISPGRNAVWSTLYDVKTVSNGWEFWSRGYGHRVGMSQFGAYGRARAGQDFKTILRAYYTGVDIVQYSIGRNVKVALTKAGQQQSYLKSPSEIEILENGNVVKTVPSNTTIKIVYN